MKYLTVVLAFALLVSPLRAMDNLLILSVEYSDWHAVYDLVVDPASCTILNGAEVIALEAQRFATHLDSLNGKSQLKAAFAYLAPTLPLFGNPPGEIEFFRREVVARIGAVTGCLPLQITFLVGERRMDSWGLGNVMYGFYTGRYAGGQEALTDLAANLAHFFGTRDLLDFYDKPEDRRQRVLGAALARVQENDITIQLIAELAAAVEL